MSDIKTCVTCKYHRRTHREYLDEQGRTIFCDNECHHPVNRSLISGEIVATNCEVERAWSRIADKPQCGPEGKLWSAKK